MKSSVQFEKAVRRRRQSVLERKRPIDAVEAKAVLSAVADIYHMTADDLIGGSRTSEVSEARAMCYLLLRERGHDDDAIATAVGKRNRGVVDYALQRYEVVFAEGAAREAIERGRRIVRVRAAQGLGR